MLITATGIVAALGAAWYIIFGLKDYHLTPAQIQQRYSYQTPAQLELQQHSKDPQNVDFTFRSFDGAVVNGHIRYPKAQSELNGPVPVLIGAHAMGRSHQRWWSASYKDRPTQENTDKITAMALAKGYAVIAIDARNHGERKDPHHSVIDVINNLHWWGEREPYEQMLVDTVRDHRVLLDWVVQQPQFDTSQLHMAGYSMGAQISLLLAANDKRIQKIAAIVPPHMNNKTAIVAPGTMLSGLADNPVLLLTANDDEYATEKQNQQFFNALPNKNKQHKAFDGGHLLPADYTKQLENWLE